MLLTLNTPNRSGAGVLFQHLLHCHWDFQQTTENWYDVSHLHRGLLVNLKEVIFLAGMDRKVNNF